MQRRDRAPNPLPPPPWTKGSCQICRKIALQNPWQLWVKIYCTKERWSCVLQILIGIQSPCCDCDRESVTKILHKARSIRYDTLKKVNKYIDYLKHIICESIFWNKISKTALNSIAKEEWYYLSRPNEKNYTNQYWISKQIDKDSDPRLKLKCDEGGTDFEEIAAYTMVSLCINHKPC